MADNSYNLEIKIVSKNGYHTPAEAKAYYGKYSRTGITWHWWGDGGAGTHDSTVAYISNNAAKGIGSANYVLSNSKITLLVNPDNVAWCSQAGNPTTVSVELQTFLNAEGYKKAGWLADQLRQRYGHDMAYYKHSDWFQTTCPGTIDINRIRQEENKWRSGVYDKPAPVSPKKVKLSWVKFPGGARKYIVNKNTNLWDIDKSTWDSISPVKPFKKGEKLVIFGTVLNKALNATYLVTEYSFGKKIANGFSQADLDRVIPPIVVPVPITTPEPVPALESKIISLNNQIAKLTQQNKDLARSVTAITSQLSDNKKALAISEAENKRLKKTQGNVSDKSLGELLVLAFNKLFKIK